MSFIAEIAPDAAVADENERLRQVISDDADNARLIMHESDVAREENAKLQDENASLRDMLARERAGYELGHCPACANISDLQDALAENARLRERIGLLESCIRGDADGIYRLAKSTGYPHIDSLMKSVRTRLRELGIEVEG